MTNGAKRFLSLAFAGAFCAITMGLAAQGVQAASTSAAAASQGEVLLTVSVEGGEGAARQLTLDDMKALGAEHFETTTIWTSGMQSFTGVPLADLLAQFDLSSDTPGASVKARAVNDYTVDIPLSDAVSGGAIIAYLRNGKTMSLRGKGPLWLVYPYDSNPDYRTEAVYSRSIWQLNQLILRSASE